MPLTSEQHLQDTEYSKPSKLSLLRVSQYMSGNRLFQEKTLFCANTLLDSYKVTRFSEIRYEEKSYILDIVLLKSSLH